MEVYVATCPKQVCLFKFNESIVQFLFYALITVIICLLPVIGYTNQSYEYLSPPSKLLGGLLPVVQAERG